VWALSVVLSFIVNLIMETWARHSMAMALQFLFQSPAVFLFNTAIIFTSYSIVLLFRRRLSWYIFLSFLWIAIGTVNGILLLNRMTPFTVKDIATVKDGLAIAPDYFSTAALILAAAGAAALIGGIILLFIFGPKIKSKINYRKNIVLVLVIVAGMFGASQLAIQTRTVSTYFENIAFAYSDYGVPYCFISTWINTGIPKPANYSAAAVRRVFSKGELGKAGVYQVPKATNTAQEHPNIIFLQLESFIDPTQFKGTEYSQDPAPEFRKLMEQYSSGYLTVPVVGAGTVNTEFEAITGMSAKFFGPGEFPYETILLKKTFESIPYDLRDIGYATHAVHDHRGDFYGRNKVFPNLGFDTFTSVEYMNNVVENEKGWEEDKVLTGQIMETLKTTKGRDYIYTISVQGHGKYPMLPVLQSPAIKVLKAPAGQKWAYEYYANQIYQMDQFIKQLTDQLSKFKEPTVLVMYGDHLPVLGETQQTMESGDLFKTEYVIWNNFGMKKINENLYAYQIGADVLNRLNIHTGLLVRYHQDYQPAAGQPATNYLKNLKLLGYDMLYGKDYIYGGINPFQPTKMKMGIKPIKIDRVVQIGGNYYLKGQNFTMYSKISLNGKVLDTIYLGPTILGLKGKINPADVNKMEVSQMAQNGILSTTDEADD